MNILVSIFDLFALVMSGNVLLYQSAFNLPTPKKMKDTKSQFDLFVCSLLWCATKSHGCQTITIIYVVVVPTFAAELAYLFDGHQVKQALVKNANVSCP